MAKKRKVGRPRGSIGEARDARRTELLDSLAAHVLRTKRLPALQGIAKVCGISVSTLVHYFGSRETVCKELIRHFGGIGRQQHLPRVRVPSGDAASSIKAVCDDIAQALLGPVHAIHEFGWVEGLERPEVARIYMDDILDATLDAVAERIEAHARRGDLRSDDPRADALQLVAPVILASFHQNAFAGSETHPLDLRAIAAESAARFLLIKKFASRSKKASNK
jgi:AcrR family transcriptional regulator